MLFYGVAAPQHLASRFEVCACAGHKATEDGMAGQDGPAGHRCVQGGATPAACRRGISQAACDPRGLHEEPRSVALHP